MLKEPEFIAYILYSIKCLCDAFKQTAQQQYFLCDCIANLHSHTGNTYCFILKVWVWRCQYNNINKELFQSQFFNVGTSLTCTSVTTDIIAYGHFRQRLS